jgi:hypothetical protein
MLAKTVTLIPEALRCVPAVELVALLRIHGSDHARACAIYLAEIESTPPQTAEHDFMLVTMGLAKCREKPLLTFKGKMAAELLIRFIADAIGLHVVTTGRGNDRVGLARCTCGWTVNQVGPWGVIKPFLEQAGADHVARAEAGALEAI